jgi:hypothetical protein
MTRRTTRPTSALAAALLAVAAKGAVALWLDRGTVAHFRNLRVQSH